MNIIFEKIARMEKIIYPRFILVKDNFYSDIELVIKAAKDAIFFEPEHVTGFRSTTVYHEKGVKQKLEKILGIRITRWDTDPTQENGIFYQGFSKGKRKEVPGVHSDQPYNDITVVIYLTPDLPENCGTSLWKHKLTGLTDPPTAAVARKFGMTLNELRELFETECQDRSKWIETDRLGYKFNRMVAYPSGVLHSATNHYGGDLKDGRIYQTFRVGVDWSTFRGS